MTPHRLDPVLRHVRGVGTPPPDEPDAALLAQFGRTGDEAAFAGLVRRHGPMVLGLCRRLLADTHAADDAFQATFLVLAQKARRLRDPDRLGPWLFGVARRVALKVRARGERRREVAAVDVPAPPADVDDLRPVLDAAIAQLPARYRGPVVLCYLEGLTNVEAAERLRCPLGTVATRLSRARDRLRVLLTRRGVAPAAGAVAAALTPDATAVVVSDDLLHMTARWAAAYAAGSVAAIPVNILTLSREAVRAMLLDKLQVVAVVAILGVTGAGVALSRQTGGGPPAKADAPPVVKNAKPNEPGRPFERAIPLALLRQKPADAYRVDSGDVLGVFVEGILGKNSESPPVIQMTSATSPSSPPAIGYPLPVLENGILALPLLDPIDVRGKTVLELQTIVANEYKMRQMIAPGSRVMVSIAKTRTVRVTVVRQGSPTSRPVITALEMPAYENDVLSALARSGGLPGGDEIVIQRGGPAAGATADAVAAGVHQVKIPLHVRPDKPLPFMPDDIILKTGDVLFIDGRDEPAPAGVAGADKPAWPPAALTLAVAAPDGKILVQTPGGSWKLYDAAKLSATDTDGKPVANVAERLKAMTAVLVAADGKPPAGQYLQLVKPGTLVLTIKD